MAKVFNNKQNSVRTKELGNLERDNSKFLKQVVNPLLEEIANLAEKIDSLQFSEELATLKTHTLQAQVKLLENTIQTLTAEIGRLKRQQPEMQSEENRQSINTIGLVFAILKANTLDANLLLTILNHMIETKKQGYDNPHTLLFSNTCREEKSPTLNAVNNNTTISVA